MKRIIQLFLIAIPIFFSSCSLLQVSVGSDVEPLTKNELSKRFTVRTFSSDFIFQVSSVADSIEASATLLDYKRNAIKWKLNVANTISPAAYQTKGDLALLETWIFCVRMNRFLHSDYANTLFGLENLTKVQACAALGEEQMQKSAKRLLSNAEYQSTVSFVDDYSKQNPFATLDFSLANIANEYREYMQIPDSLMLSELGTIPEVVGDLTERMEMYSKQVQRNMQWRSDAVKLNWENDSIAQKILQQSDTLAALLASLSEIARNSPEMATEIAANVNEQMQPVIKDVNDLMYNSLDLFNQQRDSIQKFIDQQRMALQQDIVTSGDSLMHSAADSLAHFVRKISLTIVLVVLLLIVMLFGLPFLLGYYIARLRYQSRKSSRKEDEAKSMIEIAKAEENALTDIASARKTEANATKNKI